MKLISALIFGFIFGNTIGAMELPHEAILCLSEPILNEPFNFFYKIKATITDQKIGYIKYKRIDKRKWEIKEIFVDEPYRKSDKKVGFNLFNAAIKDIYSKNPDKIEWTVAPIGEGKQMKINELITIYERMIPKLEIPHTYTFKHKPFGYASEMALEFK